MKKIAQVFVDDWSKVGPLYEATIDEDGPQIFAPDEAAVLVAYTEYGEIYHHTHDFGVDFELAERIAQRVRDAGEINEEHWFFYRNCYGSQAYIDSGDEEAWLERERREDI